MTDWIEEISHKLDANALGHVWKRDTDGLVDLFATEFENHNGPECVKCGYGYCHHCHTMPLIECPMANQVEIQGLEDTGVRE